MTPPTITEAEKLINEPSALVLAGMLTSAGTMLEAGPDGSGAEFLNAVRREYLAALHYRLAEFDGDVVAAARALKAPAPEIASLCDDCVPAYSDVRWAAFVDLKAHQVELDDVPAFASFDEGAAGALTVLATELIGSLSDLVSSTFAPQDEQ